MFYPALPPAPPPLTVMETDISATPSQLEGGAPIDSSTDTKLHSKVVDRGGKEDNQNKERKVLSTNAISYDQEEEMRREEEGEIFSTQIQNEEQNFPPSLHPATRYTPTPQTLSPPLVPTISPLAQQNDQSPDLGGSPPSLQTQPSTPDQQPFQPKNPAFLQPYPTAPSITVLTPSAYGNSEGRAAIGFGWQTPSASSSDIEGGVGVSVGLGDSQQAVGLDIGVSVSVTPEQFADRAALSAKLHRQLSKDWAIAAGVRSVINFNSDKNSLDEGEVSVYGVVTKQFRLRPDQSDPFSRLYLSVGVGGGQFRRLSDREDDVNSLGVFGSVAVRVAQPVNAIAEWTGQDFILGFSWTPIPRVPLVITPAVDTTGNAAGENRFLLGIGYGFSF